MSEFKGQKALDKYIKDKHSQEECIGFIDGYNQAIEETKAPELVDMLEIVIKDYENVIPQSPARDNRIEQIKHLIKTVTQKN